ncbi:LPP20 family lipoprotein [Neisseriaceae bacterium TC5R-5]|nr:LPP20 family lipoprotein [Neisseriaceae bacterium TC5R-5]
MKIANLRFIPLSFALLLSACGSMNNASSSHGAMVPTGLGFVGSGSEMQEGKTELRAPNPYQPIVVRVIGSGAAPYSSSLTPSQRKLLAMRAARLDAFRSIAEQVQGMKLVGDSAVSNMIANSDSFRTYVDAYLRGVNVVSTTMRPDGTSEAVAEIVLDQEFYQQFRMALEKTGSVAGAAQQSPAAGALCPEGGCVVQPAATMTISPHSSVAPVAAMPMAATSSPPVVMPAAVAQPVVATRFNNNFYVAQ